jgi:hypothetical protein
MQNHRSRKIDTQGLIALAVLNDIDNVFVEKISKLRTPSKFKYPGR